MRFLAFALIWVSLAFGVVAATTAYVWRVPQQGQVEWFRLGETPEGEPRYAELWRDAGVAAPGAPLVPAGTPLTPDVVERLQEAGVERVHVKSFRIGRWTHLPYFLAACVGLLAGAILTRLSTARAVRMAEEGHAAGDEMAPEEALKELRAVVRALLHDAPEAEDPERACRDITHRLGDALRDLVPLIVEARDRLVARMGLASYAGFMDTFAAAERSMNRAWSAAADEVIDESLEALERAAERLAIADDKLSGRAPSLLPLG